MTSLIDAVSLPTFRAWARRVPPQELALPVVLVALLVTGRIVEPEVFLTRSNLLTVLTQASITGVVAIAMTFVIATGGIDLSVGSMLAASGIAGAQFIDHGSWAFIGGTLAFALLLGLINGLVISYGRVVPFIATLAMLTGARGVALWMSNKTPVSLLDLSIVHDIAYTRVFGIPGPAIAFVAVTAIGWVVLNRTAFGRYVVAVGGNRTAARIAGIPTRRIVVTVYLITALCSGLAAVLLAGRLGSASPIVGSLLELDAIAAVVIGGTSLAGGRATIVGTFLGVLTFALIFNLLNLLDMPTEIQQIAKGVITLAAVVAQRRES